MQLTIHQQYMAKALTLAKLGQCTVSPNPMVGTVIVKNNQIIGQGFHLRTGESHSEVLALQMAENAAKDATAYITLEPCCHTGKTPPCTLALIKAGLKKIYVACLDPNPLVCGKGIEALREAGIEVEVGCLEKEATQLNRVFFHYIKTSMPFVISKWAMSLDGKTITHLTDTKNISSTKTKNASHQLREKVDAILIGAKTAIADDPLLTVRYGENALTAATTYRQPQRIILTRRAQLPSTLKIFDPHMPSKTLIATTDAIDAYHHQLFEKKNIELLIFPQNKEGNIDLRQLLTTLGKRKITSLLIEGGMQVHEDFFSNHCVNELHVYIAPIIIGNQAQKQSVKKYSLSEMHGDIYFSGSLHV